MKGYDFMELEYTKVGDYYIPNLIAPNMKDFKIGKYEVTSGVWTIVKSWAENNGYEFGGTGNLGWPDSNNSESILN